jgi:hypothetical protein
MKARLLFEKRCHFILGKFVNLLFAVVREKFGV